MSNEEGQPRSTTDASWSMKARLRSDLGSAMQARSLLEVSVLRALVAAIDNAQAVPIADSHARYVVGRFADGSAEVPRRALTERDLQLIIERELADRHTAAVELERCGKSDAASVSRAEADVITRYLSKT